MIWHDLSYEPLVHSETVDHCDECKKERYFHLKVTLANLSMCLEKVKRRVVRELRLSRTD